MNKSAGAPSSLARVADITSAGRSRNMAAIRRRDTAPEVQLRRTLHRLGYRFRVDHRLDLPSGRVRPDIVFTRQRLAVFVDGCFFHACPQHGQRTNIRNPEYWGPKLQGNIDRDRRALEVLSNAGWRAIRIWEHEPTDLAVAAVTRALEGTEVQQRITERTD